MLGDGLVCLELKPTNIEIFEYLNLSDNLTLWHFPFLNFAAVSVSMSVGVVRSYSIAQYKLKIVNNLKLRIIRA